MGNLVGRETDKKSKTKGPRSGYGEKSTGILEAIDHTKLPTRADSGEKSHATIVSDVQDGKEQDTEIGEVDIKVKLEELCNEDVVPTVFKWEGGGKDVFLTGTFNKWQVKVPMHRSGNDFTYIQELKRGRHEYKFIVDNEWRFAPEQLTTADDSGYINNIVDLTNFDRTFQNDPSALSQDKEIVDDKLYDDEYAPDPDDPQWYTKEPPQLPPHLRQIILNAKTPKGSDHGNSMPVPQHVTLNHLYCTAIKDNLMVLGMTQRFREKHITTVFYSPLPE